MDVVNRRPRTLQRAIPYVAIAALLAIVISAAYRWWSFRGVEAAFPISDLVIDQVRRESLADEVHAAGIIAPERAQIVASGTDGIVSELFVRPGSRVELGSTLARLLNPSLQANVETARSELAVAQANLQSLTAEAEASKLDKDSIYQAALSDSGETELVAKSNDLLYSKGLISRLADTLGRYTAQQSHVQAEIKRRQVYVDSVEYSEKIAAARAQIEQLSDALRTAEAGVAAGDIKAASDGVIQTVDVRTGQHVKLGDEIATIDQLSDLKAVLQVDETDMRGVSVGEPAVVEVGGLKQRAVVERIAPAAQDGSVSVDARFISLTGTARPDENVDGTIFRSHASNVLTVAQPVNSQSHSIMYLYKLSADRDSAARTRVRLGFGSSDRVEVLEGLRAGDLVVVSDTTPFQGAPTVVLR
jgi:multidrug efflux pump subunit AcrA (membrane-fusion protein)